MRDRHDAGCERAGTSGDRHQGKLEDSGPGQRPRPLPPTPLSAFDTYYGEPGESAMRYGDDFARHKPKCDVLFDAMAHSPGGRPTRHLDVAVQVGPMQKRLQVVGPRAWRRGMTGLTPGDPDPFTSMPLHYGHAFGGMRGYQHRGKTLYEAHPENPAGLGWAGKHTWPKMVGEAVPNLEHPKDAVRSPEGNHRPVALSAIPPAWLPRIRFGGTFDEAWRRDVAPFLPEDFDERFNQLAPADQQIGYPQGGEEVQLHNLVPGQSSLHFRLPPLAGMKVRILRKDYSNETLDAPVDTLFFETEQQRFSAIWRASTPIRRRFHEFDVIAVGAVDPQWWQARSLGIEDGACAGCAKRVIE